MIELINGDCLEVMKTIKSGSIDAIITDPPYGTTACKWDSVIDFELMWEQLNRIIKPNGAIVLFGSEPFSSALRMSNIKNYKYDWIWDKMRGSNIFNVKSMPLKQHEIISIFCNSVCKYNPQPRELKDSTKKRSRRAMNDLKVGESSIGSNFTAFKSNNKNKDFGYPQTILTFTKESNNQYKKVVYHPTQKPLLLMEYLIKTYTNENETVLDFTMGSGSTGVACKNTNRNFIGIEQDEKYFNIAKKRIEEAKYKLF